MESILHMSDLEQYAETVSTDLLKNRTGCLKPCRFTRYYDPHRLHCFHRSKAVKELFDISPVSKTVSGSFVLCRGLLKALIIPKS